MMDFENPPASPVEQFQLWFEDAKRELSVPNPNAMTLATVGADGRPEARIVLLKHFDERGAVFFTNYRSDKAKALEAHPYACLLFHWDELERQVRINGSVTKVLPDESDVYFVSRPRESRIGAWASDQSQPVASRAALDERYREAAERFGDGDVPRPEHWGGYRVALEAVEFWQGHRHRLHDRVVYTRGADNAWSVQRLCP